MLCTAVSKPSLHQAHVVLTMASATQLVSYDTWNWMGMEGWERGEMRSREDKQLEVGGGSERAVERL